MKRRIYIPLIASLMVACQSEEDLPTQLPDDYDLITFQVMTEKGQTRATSGYEQYDSGKHPGTMGAFGYYDLLQGTIPEKLSQNKIFENTEIEYAGAMWQHKNDADKKYWADYVQYNSFDFFAYMPYSSTGTEETKDDVTFSRTGEEADNAFTLTFKVVNSETCPLPLLTDSRQAPLICNMPIHEKSAKSMVVGDDGTYVKNSIQFLFDQTLTGYNVQFMIDPSMAAIRHFRVKNVEIYGDNIAEGGTVSRTYRWDAKSGLWSNSDIVWSDITRGSIAEATPFQMAYSNNDDTDPCYGASDMIVKADKYRQWGRPFYAIPDAQFNPTIAVTYDVELTDENRKDVVTRKDVKSKITLNKTNFSSLVSGKPGHINGIRILIKPRYLYVLGDEDKAEGMLLVE